jgi:hypothetical protein
MAAITSAQSGLWSATSTWIGGVVPVDGDSVTVDTSHLIDFDVDQSGFATGLAGLVINGQLRAYTTAGTYILKMAANVTFGAAGTLTAGTSGTAYPADCVFRVQLTGGFDIVSGSDSIVLYGQSPSTIAVKLSGDEAVGQTVLSVDTDVTSDIWVAGDTVDIADVNQAREIESYTIAAIAANEITIAAAGLTNAKSTGAVVTLTTRNVQIVGAGSEIGISGGDGVICTGVQFSSLIRGLSSVDDSQFNGCVFSDNLTAMVICDNNTYTNIAASDSGTAISSCDASAFSSCVLSGHGTAINGSNLNTFEACTVSGNGTCLSDANVNLFSDCTLSGSGIVAFKSSSRFLSCSFSSNTIDFSGIGHNTGYNCSLDSATQHSDYTGAAAPAWQATTIWNIGDVEGAVKAWMDGGRIIPDTGVFPTGYTTSHKFIHENANASVVYLDFPVLITDQTTNKFKVWLRRDTASMTQLPTVQIIDPADDPFFGGTALFEQAMSAGVDTWEEIDIEYVSSRVISGAVVRVSAKNTGTGNSWAQVNYDAPDPAGGDAIVVTVSEENITVTVEDCET